MFKILLQLKKILIILHSKNSWCTYTKNNKVWKKQLRLQHCITPYHAMQGVFQLLGSSIIFISTCYFSENSTCNSCKQLPVLLLQNQAFDASRSPLLLSMCYLFIWCACVWAFIYACILFMLCDSLCLWFVYVCMHNYICCFAIYAIYICLTMYWFVMFVHCSVFKISSLKLSCFMSYLYIYIYI